MDPSIEKADRIILGIDPGSIVTGWGVLGVYGKTPRLIALGTVELGRSRDPYLRLSRIHAEVTDIVARYLPDEMAIEAPFFGKNVQSMLKLGRAQGVAIAAAIARDVPITEYEPRKIKMAITGNGAASKEQVCEMLKRILNIRPETLQTKLDATDALAAALCHFYESSKPETPAGPRSWKDFIARNPDRVKGAQ